MRPAIPKIAVRTIALPMIAALVGACAHSGRPLTVSDLEARARELRLDHGEHGSTAGWNWRDGWGGDVWRFTAPDPAGYLFSISQGRYGARGDGSHVPMIEIYFIDAKGSRHGVGGTSSLLSVPLNAGVYYINVDGNRLDRGPYWLSVAVDTRRESAVRPEDPNIVEPLCVQAPTLGDAPALGTFRSRSGGARASCGGTGGGAVFIVDAKRPSRITLDAVAHFKVALEVRAACLGDTAPRLACARSGGADATVSAEVGPGRYFVVLDAAEVGPIDPSIPSAGIGGAFSLRARVEDTGR